MSDCFDHEMDAWESQEQEQLWGETRGPRPREIRKPLYENYSHDRDDFRGDPLYYHTKVRIHGIIRKSDKAYLFQLPEGEELWIPISLCKELEEESVYVYTRFLKENNYETS